jgi:segregation and condensation protein B
MNRQQRIEQASSDEAAIRADGADHPPSVERVIEAILFVGGAPLTAEAACAAVRGLTAPQFAQAIEALHRSYRRQNRPYTIRAVGESYSLTLRQAFAEVRERLHGGVREARVSPAALDVLALVAYRQPITKREIDSLKGGDSGALLRQLVRRGLVEPGRQMDGPRRDATFGTTARFLELFGLRSLDDLPQTQDLQLL